MHRGGTILLAILDRGLILLGISERGTHFIYLYRPKPCWLLAGVLLYGLCSTCTAGHLDLAVLLVLPKRDRETGFIKEAHSTAKKSMTDIFP